MIVNTTKRSACKRAREEYAVRESIRNASPTHETWDDPLLAEITPVLREAIDEALRSELARVLGAARYERVKGREGYRNGALTRELGTPMGRVKVEVPRARLTDGKG